MKQTLTKINFGKHSFIIRMLTHCSRRIFNTLVSYPKRSRVTLSSLARRPFLQSTTFSFSSDQPKTRQFKAETKKLLDIVAKSLYTDSQVFVRQLLSNSSDALEKQRFNDQSIGDLMINIDIFPSKNQLIIQDNGIGMSLDDLIQNLGTIAKSGSKEFVQNLEHQTGDVKDNIIGQFGVGFYSSFIVADLVEVISRQPGQSANKWHSDGSGTYQTCSEENCDFERGTKIILHIKESHKQFLQKTEIQQIVQKYSNFINFPITLNGEAINLVKPLWTKPKSQVKSEEYQTFYQYLTSGGEEYQYKLHFSSDVPLSIKTILYVPKTHSQKFGMSQQRGEVSLYSKKILIKKNCKELLLPNCFRFVKGVVDCEDIPLNISRQTFQDSALIAKLRTFLTKRLVKHLKDQSQKNPDEYNRWYKQFSMFIKEGSLDTDFKRDMVELNRYELNTEEGFFDLKQYITKKKDTQDVIFYSTAPSRTQASDNPHIYPLTQAGVPVIIANTHIEEIIFGEMDTYEGLKFANVETSTADVERVLKGLKEKDSDKKEEEDQTKAVPDDDLVSFSLWIKNQLQPYVDKVVVSSKNLMGPALVISPISSAMRQMAFMKTMIEQQAKSGQPRSELRNITFQFDKKNPLMLKLNDYRKESSEEASMIVRQLFDNACMQSGLQNDSKNMIKRINKMMLRIIAQKKKQENSE